MKNIDNETKELTAAFIAESFDLLDDVELKVHQFANCSGDDECVNTVFRAFHSIKGTAGYLNFKNISDITHEAETLLDIFRKEKVIPTQVEVDIIYLACDTLKRMIIKVEKEYTDEGYETDTQIIVESIQQLIANRNKSNSTLMKNDTKKSNKKKKDRLKNEKTKKEQDNFDDLVTREIIEKFVSESEALLEKVEKDILDLEKDSENVELVSSIFRDVHTIKGNAGFIGAEEIEKESMEIEGFLDKIRNKEKHVNSNVVSFLLERMDLINKRLNTLKIDKEGKLIEENDNEIEDKKQDTEYKPLGEILLEMGVVTDKELEKALVIQQSRIGEILIDRGAVNENAVKKALERQNALATVKGVEGDFSIKRKEVRINTEKLDKLFELTGELITAEAMVINNPEIAKLNIESFKKSSNYLSKITKEMQEISMSMRMIPLEGIFTKTIRLVRDLSRKSNKKIELKITGQDTEMDRKIIEELSDPLTHIIRNSIDHGIESSDERKKKGKKEIATIRLDARYEGNEIWITISDDGRGMDRAKIIKKAKERGLLKGDGKDLTDEEVWQFVFQAGFTTAEKVTDVSGRGVGMDVVRKNIEKLKGKINIKSEKNKRTEVILKIPLTVAIIDVITVKVANNLYSIPTIDILEFFQANEEQISYLENKSQIIKLRNDVMPIIKFYDFFKVKTEKNKLTDGIMVVVEREEKKAALFIDDILGNQQVVIKPLGDSFGESRGLAGCAILGNGDVSLIVDTAGIIKEILN